MVITNRIIGLSQNGNSGYYSLVARMLRIYHVFLEFTDQMENRAKDGIWELSALLSLAG